MDKICPSCKCNITKLEEIEKETIRKLSLYHRMRGIEKDRILAIKKLDKKNKER